MSPKEREQIRKARRYRRKKEGQKRLVVTSASVGIIIACFMIFKIPKPIIQEVMKTNPVSYGYNKLETKTSKITAKEQVEVTFEEVAENTPEEVEEVTAEEVTEIIPELVTEITFEEVAEIAPELVIEVIPEKVEEVTSELVIEVTPEKVEEVTPELVIEVIPEEVTEVATEETEEIATEEVSLATPENINLLAQIMYAEEGILLQLDPENAERAHKLAGSVVLHRLENGFMGATTIEEVLNSKGQYASATKNRVNNGQDIPPEVYKWAEELLTFGALGPQNLVFQAQFKQGNEVYEKIYNQYFCLSK